MNVSLQPFDFAKAVARAGVKLPTGAAQSAEEGVGHAKFQQALSQALRDVSAAQNTSSRLQREVTMDNPTVSIEETMVAMQKAQVAFQATLQTRNKLVQAYSEIMNMQV